MPTRPPATTDPMRSSPQRTMSPHAARCQSRMAAWSRALALASALLLTIVAPPVAAQGGGGSPPTCAPGVQFLSVSDALNKVRFGELQVAELSGLAYDPALQRYFAIADRAEDVPSHVFTIDVPLTPDGLGHPTIQDVTLLRTMAGTPFTGADLDGEGIVLHGDEIIIASEGGAAPEDQPAIRRFSRTGEHLGDLPVPERFQVGSTNLTFESLARSPSGASLFTANERPLPAVGHFPADGQTPDGRNRIRILRYTLTDTQGFLPAEQFYYLTEPDRRPGDVGVVELLALSETDLLVLERGFVVGQGNTARVFHVSLAGAPDVSAEPTLAAPELTPLPKTLVVDLADCPPGDATPPLGAIQPTPLLDNFEAMALGPILRDGVQTLLLLSDDNQNPLQATRLVALGLHLEEVIEGLPVPAHASDCDKPGR